MGSLALAAGNQGYLGVKTFDEDEARHRRELANVLNNVLQGKLNNTGTMTLTANAASTTLTDPRIGANSTVLVMATTSNAAGALSGLYFDTFGDGSCVAHHANDAQTDKTFRYAVLG